MKEFVAKLIGRLEELKTFKLNLADAMSELMKKDRLDNYISREETVEIVNQLAEEYGKDINVTTNNGFCEWEKNDEEYKPLCSEDGFIYVSGYFDYVFCPYCGKKIKVVE